MVEINVDHIQWDEWIKLSDEEKKRIVKQLDPYAGEGGSLIRKVYKQFREEYGGEDGILVMDYGIHLGGRYIISVTVQASKSPRIPDSYHGIEVLQLYTYATPELIEKLGENYDGIGEYIDRYYNEIKDELQRLGLTFETASKEEIVSAVEKFKRK